MKIIVLQGFKTYTHHTKRKHTNENKDMESLQKIKNKITCHTNYHNKMKFRYKTTLKIY